MACGRTSSRRIDLSPDEPATLEHWQRSTTMAAGLVRRGRMILLLADGHSLSQVARSVPVQRTVVGKWGRRFLARRLDGLSDAPGHGAKGGLSPRGRPRGARGGALARSGLRGRQGPALGHSPARLARSDADPRRRIAAVKRAGVDGSFVHRKVGQRPADDLQRHEQSLMCAWP
jgi:hypothetical protein